MDIAFHNTAFPCLRPAVQSIQNGEQTQEIRLTDNQPDVARILGAWGQVILRGKEWRSDHVILSGGIMAWVLYSPEDGKGPCCVDTWIPFQLRWDLPEGTPEGKLRFCCVLRFVDARSVSPRKIMVRTGVGVLAEAYVPMMAELSAPEKTAESVELLQMRYPVRLPREAGEKGFSLEEELNIGAAEAQPEQILYYTLRPQITDQKILSNKLAFRGSTNLHLLYSGEDGTVSSADFLLPFSQLAELEESYSSEAQGSVQLGVTDLELNRDDDGRLRVKCGLLAQYLVDDVQLLDIVEDAYCPGHAMQVQREELKLPAVLEKRTETMLGEQTLPGSGSQAADVSFLPDFPKQFRENGGITLEAPGTVQLLYYGEDGSLQSACCRWEAKLEIPLDDAAELTAIPQSLPEPQISFGNGQIQLRGELPLQLTASGGRGLPVVTGLELGEAISRDGARPSLILRRAGGSSLWDIAKSCGSTVAAIRAANSLTEEPNPRQMLLIPMD